MRAKVEAAGLSEQVYIDSAGTADWHIGKSPDARSIEKGRERGYDLTPLRARQVQTADFQKFDYVLAMDDANLNDLQMLQPQNSLTQAHLFLRQYGATTEHNVPDPYYGGEEGFEHVLDLLEAACDRLLSEIQQKLIASDSL